MQRLEVSGAVRLIYRSLGVKGLSNQGSHFQCSRAVGACDILNKKHTCYSLDRNFRRETELPILQIALCL